MGLVVKASHLGLDEQVAIKMLRDDIPIADATIARFIQEAQAVTKLKSEHIVRVTDVYPDGRSILIVDYVRRARYRDGWEKEVFMEPGKVYKVAFDVGSLSQIFNKGHRIRVTVASTGAPFFEPNPNTGEPLGLEPLTEKNTVVAKNTVYFNKEHASRILAPLRP